MALSFASGAAQSIISCYSIHHQLSRHREAHEEQLHDVVAAGLVSAAGRAARMLCRRHHQGAGQDR
jgi:hypothetical protein